LSPLQYKKGIIQSLLHRSFEICSSYQLIQKEFQNIKSSFLSNGYPDWFIVKEIKIFLNKRYKNTPKNKQEKTTDILRILLYLPYLGETSLQLEKELRNFYRKQLKELAHRCLVHKTHTIGDHCTRTSKHIWNDAMWYINVNFRVVILVLDKLKEI